MSTPYIINKQYVNLRLHILNILMFVTISKVLTSTLNLSISPFLNYHTLSRVKPKQFPFEWPHTSLLTLWNTCPTGLVSYSLTVLYHEIYYLSSITPFCYYVSCECFVQWFGRLFLFYNLRHSLCLARTWLVSALSLSLGFDGVCKVKVFNIQCALNAYFPTVCCCQLKGWALFVYMSFIRQCLPICVCVCSSKSL